jgi:16S rRNA G527 N7-methylase RsmG
MIGLKNVEVRQADVATVAERFDSVTFRASLPLDAALGVLPKLLSAKGNAVFGLSRRHEPPDIDAIADSVSADWSIELVEALPEVLDSPAWLLRISPT